MTALALVPAFPETVSLPLASEQARIEEYVRQSRAKSTLRGYRSDWREFEAWCNDRNTPAMPARQEANLRLPGRVRGSWPQGGQHPEATERDRCRPYGAWARVAHK